MPENTVNIRIPDPLELQQYRIQVGDTVEFIEKMTGTQNDLDAFSGQLNLTVADMQSAANQITARYAQILQTGQQVADDKSTVEQLRTATSEDRVLTQQAATLAGQYLQATEQERQAAQQDAILAGQHLQATEQERQAAQQAAQLAVDSSQSAALDRQDAQQAASGALTSEQQAAMWAQAILDAGTSGFIRLRYDQRVLLRSLDPAESSRVLVEHLGLFSYDPAASELDDDSTYFAAAAGGWVLELPAIETLLMLLDVSARQTILEHQASLARLDRWIIAQAGRQRRIHGICSITSLAAGATASFSVGSNDVSPDDGVNITPPVSLHPLHASAICTAGSVVIHITNTTASAVSVPSAARGNANPWAITLFKAEVTQ